MTYTNCTMWKKVFNVLAFTVLLVGGLNWMIVGIFNFNLISTAFMGARSIGAITVYILMGVSAIWLIVSSITSNGNIKLGEGKTRNRE